MSPGWPASRSHRIACGIRTTVGGFAKAGVGVASLLDSRGGSLEKLSFQVERRGIDYVPENERWATPRNIGALWSGSSINIAYFIYGALLMGFGFSLKMAMILIVVGNLSYLLVGVASLQGPQTGTTTFAISRAAFGTRGARIVSFFNWVTQLGFETEALILIVGAAIVMSQLVGIDVTNPLKVFYVVLACAVQTILPYFGHATMVRMLRALILPFVAAFTLVSFFIFRHASVSFHGVAGGWQLFSAGLAFVFALSGLGWTECANDYTRYLAPDVKRRSVIGWIALGTAVPEIILMTLGALTFTFLSSASVWNGANPFEVLVSQSAFPRALVLLLLGFAIVQMFAIDALVLYSSGVSLQATGFKIKRYQAVLLDSILACALTLWAVFQSSFSIYTKDFVGVIIIWIAPWLGIFLVDWLLRARRYNAAELQRADPQGLYFVGRHGVNWNGIAAFVAGIVSATACFSKAPPPVNFPFHWMTPIANHFGAFFCSGAPAAQCGPTGWIGGADFSAPAGVIVGAVVYLILETITGVVAAQVDRDEATVA